LSAAIVRQVKKRDPIIPLAEFINRRLSTGATLAQDITRRSGMTPSSTAPQSEQSIPTQRVYTV
jgi:hypothetical protein